MGPQIKKLLLSYTRLLFVPFLNMLLQFGVPIWSRTRLKRSSGGHHAWRKRRGEMEYEERLNILKWPTLEKRMRRVYCYLVDCYSTVFGLIIRLEAIPVE